MRSLTKAKTIFCDIDGTILPHSGEMETLIDHVYNDKNLSLLPGVKEKFQEWEEQGHNIILTTGRRESLRDATEKQLIKAGISYDLLIMGIGGGQRVLINDLKPDSKEPTAVAICIERNKGMEGVTV